MANKQNFKDAMELGVYNNVKVYKQCNWENGQKIEGSHKSGEGNFGMWYLYDVKYNGTYYSLFGNDSNKALLDSGEVSLNVWFTKGKLGVEVLRTDDILAQPQNQPKLASSPNTGIDTQERIIRGMCFNNACVLIAPGGEVLGEKIREIKNLSKHLYKEMKPWLEGKDHFNDVTKMVTEDPGPEYNGEKIDILENPF